MNGKKGSEYPADFWIFNSVGFIECDVDAIESQLASLSPTIECLILKTGFAQNRGKEIYWKEQPVIKAKLANVLRARFPNLRLFGFDIVNE